MIKQKDIFILEKESVKSALKKLDKTAEKVLLVVNRHDRLLGTITDGDIRRYILKGASLEKNVSEIYNKEPRYIRTADFSIRRVRKILAENKIELIPILDEEDRPVDFVSWSQAFGEEGVGPLRGGKINIPVVIMAGGKGGRLEPFTRILPKPLIPIGDKPIIELIIDEFRKQGVKKYFVTLNDKGEMVEMYFKNIKKDYELEYIWEKKGFLGTAGSLKSMENKVEDIFIVSNCDIIIKANFENVIKSHRDQKAYLTVLSSIQHYKIPYGVIKFKDGGDVTDIEEKPEYTFSINAGVYVLSKSCLQFIPSGARFDMTDLIRKLIRNKKRVTMYPVNESDYIDIGQWEEYEKSVKKLQLFK